VDSKKIKIADLILMHFNEMFYWTKEKQINEFYSENEHINLNSASDGNSISNFNFET
jgi:hypothetical protein